MQNKVCKYGPYVINLSTRHLTNEDGSPAKWRAYADIVRENGNDELLVPMIFPPHEFDTEQEALTYAAVTVKDLIDSGHCKI